MEKIDLKPLIKKMEELSLHGRTALLPALHHAQEIYGYIPERAAELIANNLNIPLAEVFGVIEFYTLLFKQPVGKTIVHVCNDPACALAGADKLMKVVNRKYQFHDASQPEQPLITIERSPCLGLCESAPAALVQGTPKAGVNIDFWDEIISGGGESPKPKIDGDISLLTKNCKNNKRTDLRDYIKNGGYEALKKALTSNPKQLINQIKDSGLVGRGGAAFPTGIKWESAANEKTEDKYIICNGDEAEPGTFKDRILMEYDPHSILEGMLIAAFAIGANKGYFYIRGEYLPAYDSIQEAVEKATKSNLIGKNILGTNFSFDIELRRGAGAYVCGEETALMESIEGKRGFPRIKPPFPTTAGLFGKPTVMNNVETLANIPIIINLGVDKYRNLGTQKSPGPKLFCLSGDINKPGLYEIPFGKTLRHLIFDLAGGMKNGQAFNAALIGGAAGTFAIEEHLDVKLSFEDLNHHNLALGSGVITVFDQSRNLLDICERLAYFFAEESCGKCYPCQLGTHLQHEIVKRIRESKTQQNNKNKLLDIIDTMTATSLCGLGQTAGSAIRSAIEYWPELFEDPIQKMTTEVKHG